jgi:glycosyltransferase involved in cell wall biosynthesis
LKIACVVHRFGAAIAGGSEGHCRAVAQRLAAGHDVTVLTTCAADHVSWRNQFPAGESLDQGVRVRRFPVARERALARYGEITERVFDASAGVAEEEQWFRENGPDAPSLIDHLRRHGTDYDRVLFWAFRYATTYFGVTAVPAGRTRTILVPTAESDPVIRFEATARLFTRPSGFVFLTPEEAELVAAHTPSSLASSCIVGTGLDPSTGLRASPSTGLRASPSTRAARPGPAPAPSGVGGPFLLYLGRVDPNKGCETLLRHYLRWSERTDLRVPLVLAGPANMPIPEHPSVTFLGYVDDARRDALLTAAAALVVPSPYESLSIVLLEAWNRGTPALVNGGCDVLRGQAIRSDGALYYRTADEFVHAVEQLLRNPDIRRQLGQNGLAYVDREYRWPVVMGKLEQFLAGL